MPGKTPLVGWIKGYMVPELMGIEVKQTFFFFFHVKFTLFHQPYFFTFVRLMMF